MIVRSEWDRPRLNGPLPYYYTLCFPLLGGTLESDPSKVVEPHRLVFVPEYDERVHEPDIYINVWDVPWRWICQSCYMATGSDRGIFKTDWVKREHLGERGDRNRGGWFAPSDSQQQQISDHGRQHQIMWSWARSLK